MWDNRNKIENLNSEKLKAFFCFGNAGIRIHKSLKRQISVRETLVARNGNRAKAAKQAFHH